MKAGFSLNIKLLIAIVPGIALAILVGCKSVENKNPNPAELNLKARKLEGILQNLVKLTEDSPDPLIRSTIQGSMARIQSRKLQIVLNQFQSGPTRCFPAPGRLSRTIQSSEIAGIPFQRIFSFL